MKLHIDDKGKIIIDGSGDLVVTKNDDAISLGRGLEGLTIKSCTFLGCQTRKIRATWESLKWIWLPMNRKI